MMPTIGLAKQHRSIEALVPASNQSDMIDDLTDGMIYCNREFTKACTSNWGNVSDFWARMSSRVSASSFCDEWGPL